MTNQLSTLDFLEFSQLAYDLTSASGLATVPTPSGFTILQTVSYPSGMTAVAFINAATNQIVLSFRGSTLSAFYNDWVDADLAHIVPGIPSQTFLDAETFATSIAASNPTSTLYVTGHSLGGAEAEYVAAELSTPSNYVGGVTFAAPGVSNLLAAGVSSSDPLLKDYENQYDPIGNYTGTLGAIGPGTHVGTVIPLPASGYYSSAFLAGLLQNGVIGGIKAVIGGDAEIYHPLPVYASALFNAGSISVDPIYTSQQAPLDLIALYPNIQNLTTGSDASGNFTQTGTVLSSTSDGIVSTFVEEISTPVGANTFITSVQSGSSKVSQTESISPVGVVTLDSTTLDGLIIQSSTSDPASINVSQSGAILVGIPSQQQGDEVTLEANPNGTDAIMVGGDSSSSVQTALDFTDAGATGDTLTVLDTNSGTVDLELAIQNGDTTQISSDSSLGDVSQDFDFSGSSGTLNLDSPATFAGTISSFQPGDTIDLTGVTGVVGATLSTADVLTVHESGGGTIALNLDPTGSYASDSFLIAPDGSGGADIIDELDSGTIAFTGTAEDLLVISPGSLVGAISNFVVGDTIDLAKISANSATLSAGNVIDVHETTGGQIDLNLDPTQNYENTIFNVASDGNSGSKITIYSFTTIAVPGASSTNITGINDSGEVVGYYTAGHGSGTNYYGFTDVNGTLTTVNFPGGSSTILEGINNSGEIFGYSLDTTTYVTNYYIDSGGTISPIDISSPDELDAAPVAINNNGQILGIAYNNSSLTTNHAFIDTNGVFQNVTAPNSDSVEFVGFNDLDQVVGEYEDKFSGYGDGFIYSNGTATSLSESYAQYNSTQLAGINDSGDIVGNYFSSSTLPQGLIVNGSYATFNIPGADLTAITGINNSGEIVGNYQDPGGVNQGFEATLTASDVACFLPGTHILTDRGEVLVENLQPEDSIVTLTGRIRRLCWIGTGKALATRGRRTAATPVIVRKGALAPNVPHQDLRVTKGHSLFLDGVLIPVEFLVNHRSILWDDRAQEVTVYHLELDTHDVLLANGAAAESYRDDGNRWLFQNANSGWHLPPKPPCAPVLTGGPIVDAVWRRLLDRDGPRPSVPLTADPDLHLLVDGTRLDGGMQSGDFHIFSLPRAPGEVRLISRAAAPQELGLSRDPRCLGVAIRRIVVRQRTRFQKFDANDKRLVEGFHAFEADENFRWTDGDALLPPEMFAGLTGPIEVVLHIALTAQYAEGVAVARAA